MIRIEDVRFGNLVYNTRGEIAPIDLEAMRYLLKYGNSGLCQVKPIILSEEWLLKAGFEKTDNGHIIRINELLWLEIDNNGFIELRRKREWGAINKGYAKITLPSQIKYIHQLQNAWQVLTNSELTFKI